MFWAKTEFKIIGPVVRYDGFGFTQREQLIYWWNICRWPHVNLLFLLPPYYGVLLIPAASSLLPLPRDRRPARPCIPFTRYPPPSPGHCRGTCSSASAS